MMTANFPIPVLLPAPKVLEVLGDGVCFEGWGAQLHTDGAAVTWGSFILEVMEEALDLAKIVITRPGGDKEQFGVRLREAAVRPGQPEAYRLRIDENGILLEAATAAGALHGAVTLRQLARQAPAKGALPCVHIEDWPDFPHRGFMLDVSRCKMPAMDELYALADLMAELKLNQLQLYTEHTFAYQKHRTVWADASPLTAEEIRTLDDHCRRRHIELVPNQNSFGHLERWLRHAPYAPLAEAPDGFVTPWGERRDKPSTLNPINPKSLRLVAELYDELLPNFRSRLFNVGCDETFDLGQGRSREECERRGKGRVYLEFLQKIHRLVAERGHTMQFWGDIILHHPELIPELPKDVVPLVWGYEAEHPFAEQCAAFAKAGFRFYVCPGTSGWQALGGRAANALANLHSAAKAGLEYGAEGYLITDWGDFGHLQPWAVSLLPLACGAGMAWNVEKGGVGESATFPALDLHIFQDKSGRMAQAAFDLGNVYRETGVLLCNASVLSRILLTPPDKPLPKDGAWANLTPAGLAAAESAITRAESALAKARPGCRDRETLLAEFRQAAVLMRHACHLGLARLANPDGMLAAADSVTQERLAAELDRLIAEQRRVWLLRNREGGLAESLALLERCLECIGLEKRPVSAGTSPQTH